MYCRILASLLIFLFSLFLTPGPIRAAEQLQTAWIGEHESFLVWYAKQKGWDKEVGLDIRMLRFGSGEKIVSTQGQYDWAIAGCGAVPVLMTEQNSQFYVIGVGNDESDTTAIYVRPDSPILKTEIPGHRGVYGSADTVRGRVVLCPEGTSAHYLLNTWLHLLGLNEKDVTIKDVLPGPAVDMFSKNFGEIIAIWAPATYAAERKGYKVAALSSACGARQPILLLASRTFADAHPEQVRAFLRMYTRVVDTMREAGPEAFVNDYVRFNKTWAQRTLTREEAAEDLRIHPIYTLDEQVELFHPEGGQLRPWLRGITAFYGQAGRMSPDRIARVNELSFLNDDFLKGLSR